MNMLKEKKNVVIAIVIAFFVIIAIIAGIALTQKPTVADNDNTETENAIDTEKDTMTMVEDSTQNDTTESEDVSDTEDSETEEEETDSQTPSSEEDETDDTDDGKDDVDDSEEQEEPADSEEEPEEPSDDEDEDTLSPQAKKLVNAGYGVIVAFGDGNYGVLTHVDGYANGKHGFDILEEYLASMDLEANIQGGYIDADKDWYMFTTYNVRERIDETDEEFWD